MGNVKLVPEQLIVGGRYRLEEKLGQGGFGVVWKCWDTLECRHVAMKTLLPSIAENEGSVPRFRREIIAAARLSHPNIVQILEAGQLDDGRPFFMMEFLFGEGVEGYADDFGALLDLFCQLLAALAYAHARGVIHRDLKPDNVIVTSESDGGLTLKLLDFGVAMVAEGFGGEARQVSLTNPGLPVGTISYMSPEQASGEASSVGPASDLYSIGVMLYQLLSGKLPFVGDWMYVIVQHVGHAAKPLELRPELCVDPSGPIVGLVQRLLLKDYGARPECAQHVRAELLSIAAQGAAQRLTFLNTEKVSDLVFEGEDTLVSDELFGASEAGGALGAVHSMSLMRMREPPLVGREAEQNVLWSTVMRVTEHCEVEAVLVSGPPEYGKQRLVSWIAEEVHEAGIMRVVRVYIDQSVTSAISMAIYRWLRQPAFDRKALMKRITAVLEYDHAAAHALCDFLLSSHNPSSGEIYDDGALRDIFIGFVSAVLKVPSPRPLLVCWALGPDGDAAQIIRWLTGLATHLEQLSVPLLLVCSLDLGGEVEAEEVSAVGDAHVDRRVLWAREDIVLAEMRNFESLKMSTTLRLEPLSPEEQGQLALFYVPRLTPELLETITDRSGGNPLYVKEMVLDWVERGVLRESKTGLILTGQFDVPREIESLFVERLDDFLGSFERPDEVEKALMVLAFLGHDMSEGMLEDVFEDTSLTAADLIVEGLLEPEQKGRAGDFCLSSGVLKRVLKGRACARGLELAMRWEGIGHRIAFGLDAMIRANWELGEHCLGLAWGALDELGEGARENAARAHILDMMACMAFRRREASLLRERIKGLSKLSDEESKFEAKLRLRALLGIWMSTAALLEDDHESAKASIEVSLKIARRIGDVALEARSLHSLGRISMVSGNLKDALQTLGEAALTFRRLDRDVLSREPILGLFEADSISDQAAVMAQMGDLEAARVQIKMLLGLYRSHGDRQGEAHCLIKLVRILRQMGSIEDARALRGEAAKILQTIDDRDGLAVLKWEEATALLKMGMYEEAELQYKCAQQLFASLKNKTSMALCANARGEVARQRGELTTAVEHYSKFRDVMDGLNNAHGLGLAETNIGWCLIAAGRTRLAIEHFSRGRETLLNNAPPAAVVGAMLGLCWAMILLRDSGFGVVLREASALMKGQAELVDEDALEALSVVRGFVEAQGDAGLLEALRGFGA